MYSFPLSNHFCPLLIDITVTELKPYEDHTPKQEGKTYYKAYYEMNHPEMEAVFKVKNNKEYIQPE